MVIIDIRDRNLLVTLSVPAKSPIRSRSGSHTFYNSMELICVALGACFGSELVKLCTTNKINPSVFESLNVTMENFTPKIIVQHPIDMSKEFLDEIKYTSQSCPVAKMLNKSPEIQFIHNTLPVEVLTDETKRSKCCGG